MKDIIHPKKLAFLENYPKFLRATKTCAAVGIGECTHYDWLRNDEVYNKAFIELKKRVDSDRLEEIEAEIHDRSLDRDAYGSSTLLIFEAKALDPGKYREKVADTRVIGDITIKLAVPAYDDNLRLNDGAVEGEYKEIETKQIQ